MTDPEWVALASRLVERGWTRIDRDAMAEAMWFEGLVDDFGPDHAGALVAADSLIGAYHGTVKHRADREPANAGDKP